ncbi:hypothetical protein HX744_00980 [Pseudonocardia sp. ICBG1122]|nr:hypothetical protein [Pseudonocardia pini]
MAEDLFAVDTASDGKPPLPTTSNEEARRFEKLCKSLEPGGEQAYSLYRLMSGYCHPGAEVLEFYVSEPISVQRDPKHFDNPEHWLQILCCALVWAGRSVDMLDKKRPRRNELRRAAKLLGISPELKPKKFR